jgi:hypothetical protein
MQAETAKRLSEMTDEGAFERLATAVLREADPRYASLIHTGINAEGKTVKAPVDGITFLQGADPPHLIAVHHTTTNVAGLKRKWLHDPSLVKTKKAKPAALPGDLLKTAEIVSRERAIHPGLKATLALTSNQEPSEELVREANAAARQRGLDIDIWSRSRLAHFLDSPQGQWLRFSYLGIHQERLTKELLSKLSRDSLTAFRPPGDTPEAWVERSIDATLGEERRGVVLLIAEPGLGKSVAGYKLLSRHVQSGGFGVVLPNDLVDKALTIEQAIDLALRQLHPKLAPDAGADALTLCDPSLPFLILVEDINRSGKPSELLERVANWGESHVGGNSLQPRWRVICPAWPQAMFPLKDQLRKRLEELVILCPPMTAEESRAAVRQRALLQGRTISAMDADVIAEALGHDPLLIALHEFTGAPDPNKVISRFIDGSIERTTANSAFAVADYRMALRALTQEMLGRRILDPSWNNVLSWFGLSGAVTAILRPLAVQGEIMRISAHDRITFRHDRVRDALLTSTLATRIQDGNLEDDLLHDPYFAEMFGNVATRAALSGALIAKLEQANPLALFYALANAPQPEHQAHNLIVEAIFRFLRSPAGKGPSHQHLRWYALHILSLFESPSTLAIVAEFPDQGRYGWAAQFRNGNISGGINLCSRFELGTSDPWRDRLIEHVKLRFGANLTKAIGDLLKNPGVQGGARLGAMRIAANLADPALADAIATSWEVDQARSDALEDYLIAASYCCGDDAARLLAPICENWAGLPPDIDNPSTSSKRDSLAANGARFAFRRRPPSQAIKYLIRRAEDEALRWPITYLLHEIDTPDAVEFTTRQLAAIQLRLKGSNGFSHFLLSAPDRWSRHDSYAEKPMSEVSKRRLLSLWTGESADACLREQAFRLWAAAATNADLDTLRTIDPDGALFDRALFARLRCGDHSAIPALEGKLRGEDEGYWWQAGRYLWSGSLTLALDASLTRRGEAAERSWQQQAKDLDWITSEMITRLPSEVAERLLLKHWDHLRFCPNFIHAALYTATVSLTPLIAQTMAECPDPAKAMAHVDQHYGIGRRDRGVTRLAQVESLVPYLHFLAEFTVLHFWDVCNGQGWIAFRQAHLDPLLKHPRYSEFLNEESVFKSLDGQTEPGRTPFLDIWIEQYMKTGATLDEVMNSFEKWLKAKQNISAFVAVTAVIGQFGHRKHLGMLKVLGIDPKDMVDALVEDTEFSVRRRTLQ